MASKLCIGAVATMTSVSLFGCGGDDKPSTTQKPSDSQTIAELVVGNDDLSVLKTALTAAKLVDTFNGTQNFTVFAPTDAAFYEHNDTVNCLLFTDKTELPNVLKYHVVPGVVESTDLKTESVDTLLAGEKLNITVSGKTVKVNKATVTTPDVQASNGVVHLIDGVLVPLNFDTSKCPDQSIAKTAQGVPTLSTLVTALQGADLVDFFSTVDLGTAFTVFAPNNDAFDKVPKDTISCLLDPKNKDKLTQLLDYHVVKGYVTSSDLTDGQEVPTLDNENVTVKTGKSVMINDAEVVMPDVAATNGIVHVIDGVLIPPGFKCESSVSRSVVV